MCLKLHFGRFFVFEITFQVPFKFRALFVFEFPQPKVQKKGGKGHPRCGKTHTTLKKKRVQVVPKFTAKICFGASVLNWGQPEIRHHCEPGCCLHTPCGEASSDSKGDTIGVQTACDSTVTSICVRIPSRAPKSQNRSSSSRPETWVAKGEGNRRAGQAVPGPEPGHACVERSVTPFPLKSPTKVGHPPSAVPGSKFEIFVLAADGRPPCVDHGKSSESNGNNASDHPTKAVLMRALRRRQQRWHSNASLRST